MTDREAALRSRFESAGQGHVLAFARELEPAQRTKFFAQLETIDLDLVRRLSALTRAPSGAAAHSEFAPADVFPLLRTSAEETRAREAARAGAALLAEGAVGILLVAGGQASRLGYEGPKGAFPVGPVSERSLFEIFARRVHAARSRHGARLPWFILTSEANDADTRAFFAEHAHFGLEPDDITFFRQGVAPALNPEGKILLSAKDCVFMAPNGHGGVLAALASSGALEEARARGVRYFSYFQVDNPLARPADPLFLGLHALEGARMSSKVVRKRNAAEKVGVIGRVDGKLSCIEYSDLPRELHEARDASGELVYGAGNIAMHVLDLDFVDELSSGGLQLPWHVAKKTMSVIDGRGETVRTEGYKFETFVFDALQRSGRSVTLEVDRGLEFSPVKNKDGEDSPASARADMCRLYAQWAKAAGLALPNPDESGLHPVEIDPCVAEDADELRSRRALAPKITARGHFYG